MIFCSPFACYGSFLHGDGIPSQLQLVGAQKRGQEAVFLCLNHAVFHPSAPSLQLSCVWHEDRKLYSSASNWRGLLLVPVLVAGSLHDGDNTGVQEAPGPPEDSSSDDLELLRQEEWTRAEETYGLLRPDPNEEVVYVHRQTTSRFAIAPVTWDPIPVGHNVLPEEILDDIARWYNDIHDRWKDIMHVVVMSCPQLIYVV